MMKECRSIKIEFVDACMMFSDKHPDRAKMVSHYLILDDSEAIEIHYKDGSISVYDPVYDMEIKVHDGS